MSYLIILSLESEEGLSQYFDSYGHGPYGSRWRPVESVSRRKKASEPSKVFNDVSVVIVCPNLGNFNYFKSTYKLDPKEEGLLEDFEVVYKDDGPKGP